MTLLEVLAGVQPHTCLRDLRCTDCPECRAEFLDGLVRPYDPDAPSPDDQDWWAEETRDESENPADWNPDPASARPPTKVECGRLGGRATVERHGVEHMREIGRRGFRALATFKNGGRQGALNQLVRKGRLAYRRLVHDLTDAETAEVWAMVESEGDVPPKATPAERAAVARQQMADIAAAEAR